MSEDGSFVIPTKEKKEEKAEVKTKAKPFTGPRKTQHPGHTPAIPPAIILDLKKGKITQKQFDSIVEKLKSGEKSNSGTAVSGMASTATTKG